MIVLVVLGAAVVTAAVLAVARHQLTAAEPLDVERDERWVVAHAPSWIARPLRALDARVVGGAATVVLFVAVFGCAAVVGWIFSTVDDDRGLARWDESAAEWGARRATETSTDILTFITDLGGTGYLFAAMGLLGMYHLVRGSDWRPLTYLALVGVGISLLNNGLKLIVDRDRPMIAQLTGHAGSSFPSGHSAAAAACWAAIAFILARRARRRLRLTLSTAAVVIAIGVASSRVLLGVHWVTDVVAGLLVGWTWFTVVTVAFGGRLLELGEPAERIARTAATSPARRPGRAT